MTRSSAIHIVLVLAGALTGFLFGCNDPELGDGSCDSMCDDHGFGDIEENSDGQGNWSCKCKGSGNSLDEMACRGYCDDVAGEDSSATIDDATCTCEEAA